MYLSPPYFIRQVALIDVKLEYLVPALSPLMTPIASLTIIVLALTAAFSVHLPVLHLLMIYHAHAQLLLCMSVYTDACLYMSVVDSCQKGELCLSLSSRVRQDIWWGCQTVLCQANKSSNVCFSLLCASPVKPLNCSCFLEFSKISKNLSFKVWCQSWINLLKCKTAILNHIQKF